MWPVEIISGEALVYRAFHKTFFRDGRLSRTQLKKDAAVSVDWEKYSTAEQARQRRTSPNDCGVFQLVVSEIETAIGTKTVHDPVEPTNNHPGNRSHAEIRGEMNAEKSTALITIATIIVSPA